MTGNVDCSDCSLNIGLATVVVLERNLDIAVIIKLRKVCARGKLCTLTGDSYP